MVSNNYYNEQSCNKNQNYDLVKMYNEIKSVNKISSITGINRKKLSTLLRDKGIVIMSPGDAGKIASSIYNWNDNFFKVATPTTCYIVGLIMADGHIIDNIKRKRLQIILKGEDGYLLRNISRMMCGEDIVKHVVSRNARWSNKTKLLISNTTICNDLISIGVTAGRKSGHEQFIRFNDNDLTLAFMLGYFDGDGCIRNYKRYYPKSGNTVNKARLSFSSSKRLLEDMQAFLIERKFTDRERKISYSHGCYNLYISSIPEVNSIMRAMYNSGSTLYMTRKKKIIEDIV